mgnify:FL=1
MSKKSKKAKRSKPMPKVVEQYSRSSVRPLQSTTPNEIVLKAQEYPIFGCWVMESWQDMGITPVVVARRQDNDRILFGVYMVDYYCLGVKPGRITR